MAKNLTEEQQKVWDKLTYVPPKTDFKSFAELVIGVQPMQAPTGKTFTLKVLKS